MGHPAPIPRSTALSIAALLVSVAAADDWVITFPAPSPTDTAVEKRYGAVSYTDASASSCPQCFASVRVLRDSGRSFLRIQDSVANPYLQASAFSLPLDPIWSWNHDLRRATRIRVHLRSLSGYGPSSVAIEGPATPFSSVGKDVSASIALRSAGWKWIDLPFDEFYPYSQVTGHASVQVPDSLGNLHAYSGPGDDNRVDSTLAVNTAMRDTGYLSWYTNAPVSTIFDSDSFNVLKNVRDLKFYLNGQPRKFGFDMDSLVIEGIKPQWGRIRGRTCSGERIVVDRFDADRPAGLANRLGGSWSLSTDTSSNLPPASRGRSTIDFDPDSDAWGPGRGAHLPARLARDSAWSRPEAGWARIATTLADGGGTADLTGLRAISFRIQAGQGSNQGFDSARVRGATLRLHTPDVPDSVAYFLRIPYDSIRPAPGDSGRDICVELDELRQGSWYTGKAGIKPIDPSRLSAISWTLALEDREAVSAAPSSISIREVSLWKAVSAGNRPRAGVAGRLALRGSSIEVRAPVSGGSVLEIRRMDGSLAGRTRIDAGAGTLQFPAPRERGIYVAEMRSADGFRATVPLAVP